ncbi:MAG TPA: protein phosphatase CheZ [Pseudolabrys sp.]|nr:protein phosphatase CheZ [Pseudolabrys sp.]
MQRKVFRVEQMFGSRIAARPAPERNVAQPDADATVQKLAAELALLHETIARNRRELSALIGDGDDRRMTRAAGELGAAVEGMEKATVKILKSTEVIDESARALTAALKTDFERGLCQDIQDHVVHIYEACNFQDLGGQRIGNVIATLTTIEDKVAGMLDRSKMQVSEAPAVKPAAEQGLINGPRLDGASGHTSQSDIDDMFA